jgi:hypothetical protein
MLKRCLFLLAFLISFNLYAQESNSETEEMHTDRPSKGDGAKVVSVGTIQLESGFFYQKDRTRKYKEEIFYFPETALRIGIFKKAEFRFKTRLEQDRISYPGSQGQVKSAFKTGTGLGEISCGFKLNIIEKKESESALAFQAETNIPIESEPYRTRVLEPLIKIIGQKKISEKLFTQTNIGVEIQDRGGDKITYTINPVYTLGFGYFLTDKFVIFGEANGIRKPDAPFQHGLDGGFAYRILPNLQLDAFGGFGLNEEAPDFFLNTGLCFRLPK